jgi:hypothetical protein
VEISAKFPGGTLHILGLGIDEDCAEFQQALALLRESRRQRNPKIIARLKELGLPIDLTDVYAVAGAVQAGGDERVIGRLHIAETLRRKGLVASNQEAFEKYIGEHGPAYVDKERLSPRHAIAAIRKAGGLAVLAHPAQLNCRNRAHLETVVRQLISMGLQGIEVYHTDHSPQQVRMYLDLAGRHGLAVTGGSDYHGPAKAEAMLGRPRVPLSVVTDSAPGRQMMGIELH